MTNLESYGTSDTARADVVECELCGTRLRSDKRPDPLEVGTATLVAVASHRCVPRVTTRRRA